MKIKSKQLGGFDAIRVVIDIENQDELDLFREVFNRGTKHITSSEREKLSEVLAELREY